MTDEKKTLFDLDDSLAPSLTDVIFNGYDPAGIKVLRKTTWQTILNLFFANKPAAYVPLEIINDIAHRQLWVGGFKPTKTNGCGAGSDIEMGTNKTVFDYVPFDPDDVEYAYANIPMPEDYTGGTIYFKPYWTHPAATAYKVSWGLAGVSFGDGDTLDAAVGTFIYVNDEGGTTSDLYKGALSAEVTIAGTPSAGDLIQFKACRKADDGTNDTLDVDAYLLGFVIWYPVE